MSCYAMLNYMLISIMSCPMLGRTELLDSWVLLPSCPALMALENHDKTWRPKLAILRCTETKEKPGKNRDYVGDICRYLQIIYNPPGCKPIYGYSWQKKHAQRSVTMAGKCQQQPPHVGGHFVISGLERQFQRDAEIGS